MEAITFGDIEAALISDLAPKCGVPFYSSIPDTRDDRYVTVKRGGGARRGLVMDAPIIEFECFASSRAAASALAHSVRAQVSALQGQTVSTITIYRVTEYAGPAYLRHPIHNQHRYVFTAALDVRYPR